MSYYEVDHDEFTRAMRKRLGYKGSQTVLDTVFSQLDQNGNGSLDSCELYLFVQGKRNKLLSNTDGKSQALHNLNKIFHVSLLSRINEREGTGPWSKKELREQICQVLDAQGLAPHDLLDSWDTDGDNQLSKREFLSKMKKLFVGDEPSKPRLHVWDLCIRGTVKETFKSLAGVDQMLNYVEFDKWLTRGWLGSPVRAKVADPSRPKAFGKSKATPAKELRQQIHQILEAQETSPFEVLESWDMEEDQQLSKKEFLSKMKRLFVGDDVGQVAVEAWDSSIRSMVHETFKSMAGKDDMMHYVKLHKWLTWGWQEAAVAEPEPVPLPIFTLSDESKSRNAVAAGDAPLKPEEKQARPRRQTLYCDMASKERTGGMMQWSHLKPDRTDRGACSGSSTSTCSSSLRTSASLEPVRPPSRFPSRITVRREKVRRRVPWDTPWGWSEVECVDRGREWTTMPHAKPRLRAMAAPSDDLEEGPSVQGPVPDPVEFGSALEKTMKLAQSVSLPALVPCEVVPKRKRVFRLQDSPFYTK